MNRIISLSLLGLFVFGCAKSRETKTITIKGSDTMVILSQRWAEKFMTVNPGIIIQVTGGGSGTGMAALLNGTTDLANSSRDIKASERQKLSKKYGNPGVEIRVAKDGLSVFMHESNPLDSLTVEQIRKVYTGEIRNWKDLGGTDSKIILYGRENNSGTYEYFKEHVLKNKDFVSDYQSLPGTAAVVNAVSKDPQGIGFGGAAYGKGIKYARVKADDSTKAYEPTPENVKTGDYPLSRYLYIYGKQQPTGEIKTFVDWVLSAEGQALVVDVGYFPVR